VRKKPHTCPRCGIATTEGSCCGIIFGYRPRWRMTKLLIRRVHAVALGLKGLTEEAYRLRLQAVGAETCKDFTRMQYTVFMRALAKLPDAPKASKRARAA